MLHRVEWTDKKVGEFWANIDRLIEKKERVNDYFSNRAGDEFLKCVAYSNSEFKIINKNYFLNEF